MTWGFSIFGACGPPMDSSRQAVWGSPVADRWPFVRERATAVAGLWTNRREMLSGSYRCPVDPFQRPVCDGQRAGWQVPTAALLCHGRDGQQVIGVLEARTGVAHGNGGCSGGAAAKSGQPVGVARCRRPAGRQVRGSRLRGLPVDQVLTGGGVLSRLRSGASIVTLCDAERVATPWT